MTDDMYVATEEEAKAVVLNVCYHCPVQLNCLYHALVSKEEYGVWGASKGERRLLWRELGRMFPHARQHWTPTVEDFLRNMLRDYTDQVRVFGHPKRGRRRKTSA